MQTQIHDRQLQEVEGISFLYTLKGSTVTLVVENDKYTVKRQHTINKKSLRMAKDSVYVSDGVCVIETITLEDKKISVSYYTSIYAHDKKTLPVTVQVTNHVIEAKESKAQQEYVKISFN